MKVIELLDLTVCEVVAIRQSGKTLFVGTVENVPYKYVRREVVAFGLGDVDENLAGLIINL